MNANSQRPDDVHGIDLKSIKRDECLDAYEGVDGDMSW